MNQIKTIKEACSFTCQRCFYVKDKLKSSQRNCSIEYSSSYSKRYRFPNAPSNINLGKLESVQGDTGSSN